MSEVHQKAAADSQPTTTAAVNASDLKPAANGDHSSVPSDTEEGNLLYDVLYELCQNNIEYFAKDDTINGTKIHAAFQTLCLHIDYARSKVNEIRRFAHEYDFDEHTKGNGYRSFVIVVDSCIKYSIKLCRNVLENRSTLLFRKSVYFKEVSLFSVDFQLRF